MNILPELPISPWLLVWTVISILSGAILNEFGADIYTGLKRRFLPTTRGLSDAELVVATRALHRDLDQLYDRVTSTTFEEYYPDPTIFPWYDGHVLPESQAMLEESAVFKAQRTELYAAITEEYADRIHDIHEAYEERGFDSQLRWWLPDASESQRNVTYRVLRLIRELRRLREQLAPSTNHENAQLGP